jgi:iron complex transport system permease protein
MRQHRNTFILLGIGLLAAITLFLSYDLGRGWEYALNLRFIKVSAMGVVSCCIAYSSVTFQTLTNNRILTPSIMGFESVYMLLQTVIVYIYGSESFKVLNSFDNFLLSVVCMIGFAFLLYILIYKKGKDNIFLLVLIGLILGILFHSLSSFMQLIIDPNDFFIIQGKMFASFSNINENLLGYSTVILLITLTIGFWLTKYLDVISLGRDQAKSLGLNYQRMVQIFMMIIAILVSISTALIGPITFLGILVTNLTYELMKTYRHSIIIAACCLVTAILIIGGQFLTEHLFNLSTPIATIINFVGGVYFLYLLLGLKKI